jgi:hypothetical protein
MKQHVEICPFCGNRITCATFDVVTCPECEGIFLPCGNCPDAEKCPGRCNYINQLEKGTRNE